MSTLRDVSDEELIEGLRAAASAWFSNSQLLMLEELIRRAKARLENLNALI
jgi:hypothetical protein